MEPTRLRPLQVGEVLDAAVKVYRNRFRSLFKIGLVIATPLEIVSVLALLSLPDEVFEETAAGSVDAAAVAVVGLIYALVFTGTLLVTAMTVKVISDSYLGRPADWRASLAAGVRKLPSLLWLDLLFLAFLIAGLPFLAVPTVYVYVAFSLCVPVLMLEGTPGARALHRSRRLVEGRWWPTAAALLAAFILTSVVSMFFSFVGFDAGARLDDTPMATVAGTVLTIISSSLVTPFTAVVTTVLYFDMRVRKEGLDLEQLAQSVETAAPERW